MNIDNVKEQFNKSAIQYDNNRKSVIPCFDDFYKRSVSLLKLHKMDLNNVIDLGAGTGLLTKEIYELYNNAHYTLVDISVDMLNIAKERFNGLDNFNFIEHDYIESIPGTNNDLICSALSIHHLENYEKEKLYKNIYKALNKNGCFLNLDLFIANSAKIDNLFNKWWFNYIAQNSTETDYKNRMEEGRKLDRENTIRETLDLLKDCGFEDVDCIYNFMKFGVILAMK